MKQDWQEWQKSLPEAQGSIVCVEPQRKELYRSAPFRLYRSDSSARYEVLIVAKWGDECWNGSNSFFCRPEVVVAGTDNVSSHYGAGDVPPRLLAELPTEYVALQKWNGCHPFGPWYYIQNTVHFAGDRDCWGLRKGERRQIVNGKTGQPCWHLVGIGPDGEEIPHYRLGLTHDGEKPTSEYRLEWRSWDRIGEGKERELNAARREAIWPEATDEELSVDDLVPALQARLPALLVEFRKMIEGLGFVW